WLIVSREFSDHTMTRSSRLPSLLLIGQEASPQSQVWNGLILVNGASPLRPSQNQRCRLFSSISDHLWIEFLRSRRCEFVAKALYAIDKKPSIRNFDRVIYILRK